MKDWSCQQNMEWTPQKFIGTSWILHAKEPRANLDATLDAIQGEPDCREAWMTDLIQHRNLDDTMSRTTSQEKFQEIQGVRVMSNRMAGS